MDIETQYHPQLLPAQAQAILEARAKLLARQPPESQPQRQTLEILEFQLGGQRSGIEVSLVRQVLRPTPSTPIPGAPEAIVGVLNLRGEILMLVDLRRLFGIATPPWTESSRILVLGSRRPELGLQTEAVEGILHCPLDELMSPPVEDAANRFSLRGITPDGLSVLDGAALLRDPRLFLDHGSLVPEGSP